MNPLKRWYLKHLLRVAGEKHAVGDLTDAYYGALATRVVFELAGRRLTLGDTFSPVDFELAVQHVLKKPSTDTAIAQRYGPHLGAAPVYVKNATNDWVWDIHAQGLYANALPRVTPARRFETWLATLRKNYPALTGAGGWLAAAIIGGMIGTLITRLLTHPR